MDQRFDQDVTSNPGPSLDGPPLKLSWATDLRLLMVIALPNVASMVSQTLLSIVDFSIVSVLPNASEAQAAVSSGAMVFFACFSFLMGIMVCVTTMASQSLGAKRYNDCSAYGWQGVWISAAFGILGFALWPFVPTIFGWIGHEPAVLAMEIDYTRIRLLAVGLSGAAIALGHFFNGIHQPGQNTVTVVGTNIINALLSYALVLGKWGFPALGVAGAAWGSLIATAIHVVWLMGLMCFSSRTQQFNALRMWRPNRDKMRRLLAVGWFSGINFTIDITAWAVFLMVIVGGFGTVHLAATAICFRYSELSFMPAVGIAMAVCTVVGRAIGEGRPDLARRRAAVGCIVNMAYMGSMGLIYVLAGTRLMGIFSNDSQVIQIGTRLLLFVALFQVSDAMAITYNNALRGAGDTRFPMIAAGIESWGIMILGGYWATRWWPQLESIGPWIFATLFVIAISATLWVRWCRGKWETFDIIGRDEPSAEVPDGEVPLVATLPPDGFGEPEEFGSRLGAP
ncbi:MAG: MATE family efflux transporter [Phycisphaerales bacterium]|nr:MATE family efflux transporter [Phycisphaerales bacterium]